MEVEDRTGVGLHLEGVEAAGVPGDGPLRGVDLSLAPGEWVGVVGAHGDGVGTLLAAAAGRVPLRAGSRRGPGDVLWLPRRVALGPHLRTPELLRGLGGDRGEWVRALSRLEAERWAESPVHALPPWGRTAVLLAVARASSAGLLILEDPLEDLDCVRRGAALELLEEAAAAGRAVLVSSRAGLVGPGSPPRLLGLREGRVVAEVRGAPPADWTAWLAAGAAEPAGEGGAP